MTSVLRGVTTGCMFAALGGCSGMPIIATPWGQATMARENPAVCAEHASSLNTPLPAQTRANVIADMHKRLCPNTPTE